MDNKYSKGTIYKIVDIGYNLCYLGSTCEELSKRMARHRGHYKDYQKGNCRHLTVFDIFDKHGVDHCKIELVEYYPCTNRAELLRREGWYIQQTECVNKLIMGRTKEEAKEAYKNVKQAYYHNNKEHVKDKVKAYCEENAQKVKEQHAQYYQKNKEMLAAKRKEYYAQNREVVREKQHIKYQQNKETICEKQKVWRANNKDKIKERDRRYYENLKQKRIEVETQISELKKKSDII